MQEDGKPPVNLNKMKEVQQRLDDNPSAFMQKLREFLKKHCWNSEGNGNQVILRAYFIFQTAPNIQRKFQKLAVGPETNLNQ